MENMYKYLFIGIVAVMGLVLTLRFLDRIPLWGWALFFSAWARSTSCIASAGGSDGGAGEGPELLLSVG